MVARAGDPAGGEGAPHPDDEEVCHLEALAVRLRSDGWRAQLAKPCDRTPYLRVVNPVQVALNDDITVAPMPGVTGRMPWCFWWSSGRRIACAEALDLAALRIARVLGVPGRCGGPRRALTSPTPGTVGGGDTGI